jgi:hydrogenase-1 operon protein HyaE
VAARALSPRYGFTRWPAFVMLREGQYLGVVDGLRDWGDYVSELDRLLAAAPTRPPIRVVASAAAPACH